MWSEREKDGRGGVGVQRGVLCERWGWSEGRVGRFREALGCPVCALVGGKCEITSGPVYG